MAVTASVERTHPAVVMVSVAMPKVAAELARWSTLLPPMKRAAMSSSTVDGPVGKMVLSLDRLGRVSMFIRNCVLSPSRRGVRRAFSSWGERGGTEPGRPFHPCRSKSFFSNSKREVNSTTLPGT